HADNETGEELNELLRGELSAVETYRQAMEKVGRRAELENILKEHQTAVEELRTEVSKAGETPSKDSGVWGSWAQAVTGTAKAFGTESALMALKQGEEHGLDEYEDLLDEDDIDVQVKNLIRDKYIPNQRKHIETLNRLIEQG